MFVNGEIDKEQIKVVRDSLLEHIQKPITEKAITEKKNAKTEEAITENRVIKKESKKDTNKKTHAEISSSSGSTKKRKASPKAERVCIQTLTMAMLVPGPPIKDSLEQMEAQIQRQEESHMLSSDLS